MKTEQLFVTGAREVALQPVTLPELRSGEVLIEGGWLTVCGGEVERFKGVAPDSVGSQIGHELSGTVAAVGPDVTGLRVGQGVASWVPSARGGRHWTARAQDCFSLGGVPLRNAAFAEPLMCSMNAVEAPTVRGWGALERGEDVVVIGGSAIAFGVVATAALRRPRTLVVAARRPDALERATMLGATHTIDLRHSDLAAQVRACTEERMPSCVYECIGVQPGVDYATSLIDWETRLDQRIVVVGFHQVGDTREFPERELDIAGTPVLRAHFRDMERIRAGMRDALIAIDRRLVDPLTWGARKVFGLSDAQAAMEYAADGTFLKVSIDLQR